MAADFTKTNICWCSQCSGSKFFKLFWISMLFLCAHAQNIHKAHLHGQHPKEKQLIERPPGIPKKDEGYFWEQTRQNIIDSERMYNENVDPVHEGMEKEREGRKYVYDYQGEEQENPRAYDIPTGGAFEAKHEGVIDQEFPDFSAGEGRPCSGGKMCAKREESRAMMVEALKRNILQQLKMKEPPNITVPAISLDSPPLRRIFKKYGIKREPVLPELEFELEDEEYEDDETSKEKVISYARPPMLAGLNGSFFKFNEDDLRLTVTSAVIWFYVKGNPTNRTNVTLEFYRYQRNFSHPGAPLTAVKFNRKVVRAPKKGHWKMFPISNEVGKWFVDPDTNLGIDIRCPEIPEIVTSGPVPGQEDKKPMLEVDLSHNPRSRRKKRDLGGLVCNEDSDEPRCCKYSFHIEFRSMGWDWIISPPTYRSYYCAGDCPFLFLQGNQNKMLAMHAVSKPKALSPCCAPTKMDPMSMLYFDNAGNIIYSEVPDMVVKRCGCM